MNTISFRGAAAIACLAFCRLAASQGGGEAARLAHLEAQLLSAWWGRVAGEADARIMRITRIGLRGDGNFGVDLNYGLPGSWQGPLKGALIRLGGTSEPKPDEWVGAEIYRLEFITGAGTVISAASAGPGVFIGTFATRSGNIRAIELERLSDEELQARTESAYADRRAAAQRWLSKDEIKIAYEGRWKWPIPVDMKKGAATFYYPANDYCMGTVPAEVRVDGQGMLVFVFDSKRAGCAQVQYAFDPISKSGVVRQRPAGSSPDDPWGRPSSAMVSLID